MFINTLFGVCPQHTTGPAGVCVPSWPGVVVVVVVVVTVIPVAAAAASV